MGDAIPYVSDLDYYIVISEESGNEDKQWLEQMKNELQQKHSIVNGIHLSVHSVMDLTKDKFARFVLEYNSMLCFGNDIVKELDMTREILKDPKSAGITHDEFLKRIRSFVERMFDMIEKS